MAKRSQWTEFDYTVQVGPRSQWFYRPLIEVEVSAGGAGERLRVSAMIDSGTDSTVMRSDIAKRLKIDPKQNSRVRLGGIGSVEGFLCNVRLVVPSINAGMEIPVIFVEDLPVDGLLGQQHFFQRVRVRFEKDRNKFYLAPAP